MYIVQLQISYLYNKTRHSYLYMLPIAGKTAGPNGLKFFLDIHGWPGGCHRLKKIQYFFSHPLKKTSRATPGPSASLCNKTRHSNLCSLYMAKRLKQMGWIFLREPWIPWVTSFRRWKIDREDVKGVHFTSLRRP